MSAVQTCSPEIVARICHECCSLYDIDRGRTLLALAKTCRAFTLVALGFLWSELAYEPNPLFLVLPAGSVVHRERDAEDNLSPSYMLYPARISFDSSELERFYFYAKFVQSLTVPGHPAFGSCITIVCPDIWHQLKPSRGPIFSNLRKLVFRLNWSLQAQDPMPLHYLLGPKLEILRVEFGLSFCEGQLEDAESGTSHAATSVIELLAHLPHQSPRLRLLYLTNIGPAVYAQGTLTLALQGLSSLTTFGTIRSTPLSPEGIVVLSSLPNLVSATFATRAADHLSLHDRTDRLINSVHFPALQTLHITADTAECAVALLSWSVIDPPGLLELHVEVEVSTNITSFQFASITAIFPEKRYRTTLDTVILSGCNGVRFDSPPPVAYPPSAIAHLCALPSLTQLQLRGNCYAALDDATLADMARAWPRVERLLLCPNGAGPADVTLTALHDLAVRCPHIRELHVALGDIKRATCEELLEQRPPPPTFRGDTLGTSQRYRSIWELSLGEPSIEAEDVVAVAAVLAMNFLNIHRFYIPQRLGINWDMYDRWVEVREALRRFQSVRLQERKYALERAHGAAHSV